LKVIAGFLPGFVTTRDLSLESSCDADQLGGVRCGSCATPSIVTTCEWSVVFTWPHPESYLANQTHLRSALLCNDDLLRGTCCRSCAARLVMTSEWSLGCTWPHPEPRLTNWTCLQRALLCWFRVGWYANQLRGTYCRDCAASSPSWMKLG